ncbi:MAG: efflux RND transporter periplasmic adaptor subunit, partial [Myxococcota bacterium]
MTFLMWLLAGCGGSAETGAPPPSGATPVKVMSVSTEASQHDVALIGTIDAEESVEIRPESTGPVQSLGFDHGQAVTSGHVLVRLRDAEARAAVDEAEARLALANAQLERTQALFDRQNASGSDLDKAKADRDLATAQLGRAREELRKTVVKAPFDGIAGLRLVALGEVVDPSRVVTRLEAIDRVVVDVEVPERWLTQVQVGQPATVAVDALPGEVFTGQVMFVGPRVSAETRSAPVRVQVPNADRRLRPGMTARVAIVAAAIADAILVPSQAVVTSATGAAVWVVGADGKVSPRPIEIADRNAETVRVAAGLAPGDRVVTEGLIRLRPGTAVQVVDAPPET